MGTSFPSASRTFVPLQRQFMSYPTPPGDTTPSSMSNAATPPMGKPYPSWPSGITSEAFSMPGRVATLAACERVLSERIFSKSGLLA